MKAVDLFCGAGGVTSGLYAAGFTLVDGVDLAPQPRWHGAMFHQCEALDWFDRVGRHIDYDLLWASPPCFPAGTPVVTARGIIEIESVREDDLVLTHRGRWRKVTATMQRIAQVWKGASYLQATEDHRFYTRSRVGIRELSPPGWEPFRDIGGQYLAVPSSSELLPESSEGKGTAFWWMVGRWLGDGWLRLVEPKDGRARGDVIICCAKRERDGLLTRLSETGSWRAEEQRTTVRITHHNVEIARWLHTNFRGGAFQKTIPGWALGLPDEERRALLEGYLSADGHKLKRPPNGRRATTVSPCLAISVRLLAASCGFSTSVFATKTKRTTSIEGREVNQHDLWGVQIVGGDGARKYAVADGAHVWQYLRARSAPKPGLYQPVFDLTVDEDHSFVAWGYVVHNCQGYSIMRHAPGAKGAPRLIGQVREAFRATGKPSVIENVEEARSEMINPICLCGSMFNLGAQGCQLRRHRLFECNFPVVQPACRHDSRPVIGIYGGHARKRAASAGGRGTKDVWEGGHKAAASEAMGISWMTMSEISEAIPPAFATYIGLAARQHIMTQRRAA